MLLVTVALCLHTTEYTKNFQELEEIICTLQELSSILTVTLFLLDLILLTEEVLLHCKELNLKQQILSLIKDLLQLLQMVKLLNDGKKSAINCFCHSLRDISRQEMEKTVERDEPL